jgi:hypothetical protein
MRMRVSVLSLKQLPPPLADKQLALRYRVEQPQSHRHWMCNYYQCSSTALLGGAAWTADVAAKKVHIAYKEVVRATGHAAPRRALIALGLRRTHCTARRQRHRCGVTLRHRALEGTEKVCLCVFVHWQRWWLHVGLSQLWPTWGCPNSGSISGCTKGPSKTSRARARACRARPWAAAGPAWPRRRAPPRFAKLAPSSCSINLECSVKPATMKSALMSITAPLWRPTTVYAATNCLNSRRLKPSAPYYRW